MGRGISPLQTGIMKHATEQGFIAPYEAVEIAWSFIPDDATDDYAGYDLDDKGRNGASASASRSLRRLVARGLLIYVRARFYRQSDVYRVAGWVGCLPWVERHTLANHLQRMQDGLPSQEQVDKLLDQLRSESSSYQLTLDFNQ